MDTTDDLTGLELSIVRSEIDYQLNGNLRKNVLQSYPPNREDGDIASLLATTLPVVSDPQIRKKPSTNWCGHRLPWLAGARPWIGWVNFQCGAGVSERRMRRVSLQVSGVTVIIVSHWHTAPNQRY